ncbi:SGNH/GDSL hydrolase family protein [Hyalangium rubrum]|uniref:SGNH/GDSL hydrolase family protein n=1 Tax=Hyalangium rubrum TaxID=3103134 RepID=A0ABU5HCH3_9BACT|nr:SGNH/GDSL hydrolase family protein [Hyalangium sp. s54d21]MDY7230956.1 SGNH/GDSL hydrolase family protein [Hyalangium sp. s54d21]
MSLRFNLRGASAACALAATVVSGSAAASTINQNTSWTITRTGATSTYRVVAYGDSIFAGYNGSLFSVARRAAPYASGEYLGNQWNANIEVVRRTKSGAKADDIYNNKIVAERSYMQDAKTRVVVFEMCGNDYLQARTAFKDQTGTCNYAPLDTALANCTTYMERGMQTINQYATSAKAKVIMNIYYPGYNADNVQTACTDSSTGTKVNRRDKFLPYLAKSNWRACNLAATYGFKCADAFAESMASDYDSNGDGQNDVDAIRFRAGESEAAYVARIVSLKATLRDSNTKYVNASTSFDYLQSDDTHQTYYKSTIGTGSGSAAPDFTAAQIVGGKNPEWNKWGHERTGWSISTYNPAAP